jgi:hypothetical protein
VLQLEISASRISFADDRLIEAWKNYYFLVEGVVWDGLGPAPTFPQAGSSPDRDEVEPAVASSSDPKGKGKAQSPPSDAEGEEDDDGATSEGSPEGDVEGAGREMECS